MIRIEDTHMGFHLTQDGSKYCIHYNRLDVIFKFFIEENGKRMGVRFQVATSAIGYLMRHGMKEDAIGYIKVKTVLALAKYIDRLELEETEITDQLNKELHDAISRCLDIFMDKSNKPIKLCQRET